MNRISTASLFLSTKTASLAFSWEKSLSISNNRCQKEILQLFKVERQDDHLRLRAAYAACIVPEVVVA